jgi:hypothetical protein
MFGPYNGWNNGSDILTDDGTGVYSKTLYFKAGDVEYKFFNSSDSVNGQENLLDFGTTIQGYNEWGAYYEYLNASCAPVTDYSSYANRVVTVTDADINNTKTVTACFGSCNEACLSGCTDATSCNYDADDALDSNLSGQINYDSDNGSCLQNDTCGFCGGGDANLDCAGDCSGSLADGTFTELPGSALSGSGSDWTLDACNLNGSTVSSINAFVLTVTSDYTCDFSSSVFDGSVDVSTVQTVFANADGSASSTPAGYLFNVSLSAGDQFSFNTDAIVSGAGADGITGSIVLSDSFGGLVFDCNSECGGTAAVDDCSVCAGGSTDLVANANNLGCGCYNDAALSYFEDADSDGLNDVDGDTVCDGDCLNDVDGDTVCDELEITGCQDANATNYDSAATDPAFADEWGTSSCTYASCDTIPDNDAGLDGAQGCLWDNGTSAAWWDGWWNCPDNGGQVCGMAEVNFELDHPGATAAPHVQASYNSWCGDCYNATPGAKYCLCVQTP